MVTKQEEEKKKVAYYHAKAQIENERVSIFIDQVLFHNERFQSQSERAENLNINFKSFADFKFNECDLVLSNQKPSTQSHHLIKKCYSFFSALFTFFPR